jgi:hypothetical protein
MMVAAAVLAGAACGPLALYLQRSQPATAGTATITLPDHRAGVVGDFASLFVAAWLRGDDLGFFNPNLRADDSGLLVERVAPVRTVERGPGLFDVVVAADVVEYLAGSEEQFRPVSLRFYAVGVTADSDDNLAALGLPAVVAAPPSAAVAATAITDLRRPASPDLSPLADTVAGFFNAYLTGAGDVRLFTSPESIITAVQPAPFARAEVFELGWGPIPGIDDPSLRLARVVVDASSAAERERLDYSIVMAERDGRWEVSQVLFSPLVRLDS